MEKEALLDIILQDLKELDRLLRTFSGKDHIPEAFIHLAQSKVSGIANEVGLLGSLAQSSSQTTAAPETTPQPESEPTPITAPAPEPEEEPKMEQTEEPTEEARNSPKWSPKNSLKWSPNCKNLQWPHPLRQKRPVLKKRFWANYWVRTAPPSTKNWAMARATEATRCFPPSRIYVRDWVSTTVSFFNVSCSTAVPM